MIGELKLAAVQARLVTIGIGDRGLETVADHELRRAAEKSEEIDMRADPIGQAKM